MEIVSLRAAGAGVVLDVAGPGLPRVLHWGADPGPLDRPALERLAEAVVPAVPASALDSPGPLTLLPGEPDGWSGRPGLAGHRDGADAFPRLRLTEPVRVEQTADGAQLLTARAADPVAGVGTVSDVTFSIDASFARNALTSRTAISAARPIGKP